MLFSYRFTCTKAYKNLLNELGDQAGQHELIAENLSTSVVLELASLVKQLKDDRRKVSNVMKCKTLKFRIDSINGIKRELIYEVDRIQH